MSSSRRTGDMDAWILMILIPYPQNQKMVVVLTGGTWRKGSVSDGVTVGDGRCRKVHMFVTV